MLFRSPIGIFDSGLGGLTGLKALRRFLPEENIVYFADSGRVPYGEKTRVQLRGMARQNLSFLSGFGVKAILIACGTLSSNAGDILAEWPVPAVGVLSSSADWMSRLEGDSPVAVIATAASISSGAYQRALEAACPGRRVLGIPCPDFVPLIESGRYDPDDAALRAAVAEYLTPLRDRGVEALILGCTHYGLIEQAIRAFLGDEVILIEASACAAREIGRASCRERV